MVNNTGDKRDMGSIPGWRKSPGNLLKYPCPENSTDREVLWVTWGRKESDMIKRLSAAQHKLSRDKNNLSEVVLVAFDQ